MVSDKMGNHSIHKTKKIPKIFFESVVSINNEGCECWLGGEDPKHSLFYIIDHNTLSLTTLNRFINFDYQF